MTDAEKLRKLAEWFDEKYPNDQNPEIQDDLRDMANRLEAYKGNIPDSLWYGKV